MTNNNNNNNNNKKMTIISQELIQQLNNQSQHNMKQFIKQQSLLQQQFIHSINLQLQTIQQQQYQQIQNKTIDQFKQQINQLTIENTQLRKQLQLINQKLSIKEKQYQRLSNDKSVQQSSHLKHIQALQHKIQHLQNIHQSTISTMQKTLQKKQQQLEQQKQRYGQMYCSIRLQKDNIQATYTLKLQTTIKQYQQQLQTITKQKTSEIEQLQQTIKQQSKLRSDQMQEYIDKMQQIKDLQYYFNIEDNNKGNNYHIVDGSDNNDNSQSILLQLTHKLQQKQHQINYLNRTNQLLKAKVTDAQRQLILLKKKIINIQNQ